MLDIDVIGCCVSLDAFEFFVCEEIQKCEGKCTCELSTEPFVLAVACRELSEIYLVVAGLFL